MKIIGEILSTTRDDLQDEDGATVTYLIRKANISHSSLPQSRDRARCDHESHPAIPEIGRASCRERV